MLPPFDGTYAQYVQSLFDWLDEPPLPSFPLDLIPPDTAVSSTVPILQPTVLPTLRIASLPVSVASSETSSSSESSRATSPKLFPVSMPDSIEASPIVDPFIGFVSLTYHQFSGLIQSAPVFPAATIDDPNFPPGFYALSRVRLGYRVPATKIWSYNPFTPDQASQLPPLPFKICYFKLVAS